MSDRPVTGMDVNRVFDKALQRGLIRVGMLLEDEAVVRVPVQTGRLRGSITYATTTARSQIRPSRNPDASRDDAVSRPTQKNEVYIGTNVFYGPYIEYGTNQMRKGSFGTVAQPFLRPALDNNRDEVREEFSKELARALRGE